jgi:hypothetical protein
VPDPRDPRCRFTAIVFAPLVPLIFLNAFMWCVHVSRRDDPLAVHHCPDVAFVACPGARVVTEMMADRLYCADLDLTATSRHGPIDMRALAVRPVRDRASFVMPPRPAYIAFALYCGDSASALMWACNVTTDPLGEKHCGASAREHDDDDDDSHRVRRASVKPTLFDDILYAAGAFLLSAVATWMCVCGVAIVISCCRADVNYFPDSSHDTEA